MQDEKARAVLVRLRLACAEHAQACRARGGGWAFDMVDVDTKMMNAAVRIAFEKFCYGRIGARGLHQFDFRVAEIDVGKAHTLLFVDSDRADFKPVFPADLARRGVEAGNDDRNMA